MFTDIRFPDDISYGSSGGPVFSTDVITTASGFEQRNRNWAEARAVYNVAHGIKSKEQLDRLIAFFRLCEGRAHAFRFKDWSDYSAVNQPLGIGDGSTSNFALIKEYREGNHARQRRITRPVADSVMIYVDAIAVPATIDYDTGMAALDSAPPSGAIVAADFEFDVMVRFETDQLAAQLDDYGVYSWGDIALVEVRDQ